MNKEIQKNIDGLFLSIFSFMFGIVFLSLFIISIANNGISDDKKLLAIALFSMSFLITTFSLHFIIAKILKILVLAITSIKPTETSAKPAHRDPTDEPFDWPQTIYPEITE